ncbi:hypothetical protein J2T11_001075 [Paenarthrobacter nicotinovorans]|uniref:hypothetical protein n=1 Tax=Paenarthrobacter nicotinovorans TaxID=29320 RepID=UPI00278B5B0B|nr:hypothetical protein [Paenarthrobacter nicotinovorans]MDP9934735.1 hypothetical protein [Paenarthrobacter nicotinovorans]
MTLVAVWIRRNANLRELAFAADSRISGGESWDACPKIVALPRPATVIAMSGDATEAYAFLLQAINVCGLLDGHQLGRTDLGWLARNLRQVFADSRRHVSDLPRGESATVPKLDVVLGGWSWRNLQFEAYSYTYNVNGELVMRRLPELEEHTANGVYFAGDAAPGARRYLKELIREKGLPIPMRGQPGAKNVARDAYLSWEPIEVLLKLINDPDVRTVGGVPQVLKITQNFATESFVWRDDQGLDYFGGRRLLPNERFDRRVLRRDGDTLLLSYSDRAVGYSAPVQGPRPWDATQSPQLSDPAASNSA